VICMPKGILIIKWDNEIGAILVSKYPKKLKITTKLLTNIYANHRIESTDPNFASLTLKDSKITSFFSGLGENFIGEPNHIVALVLRRDEKPHLFREILKKGAATILSNLKNDQIEKILPELFKEMSNIS